MMTITNYSEVMRDFAELNAEALQATKRSISAGTRSVNQSIRKAAPEAFRRIVGASVKLHRDGSVTAYAGFRNREGTPSSKRIPVWFKAYWSNYGTLARRYPGHRFDRKVKAYRGVAGAYRRGGIRPRLFFETGTRGWEKAFIDAFERQLDKEIAKI